VHAHLSMGINLDGSIDPRLERASESRREALRLPGKWGYAMIANVGCSEDDEERRWRWRWWVKMKMS